MPLTTVLPQVPTWRAAMLRWGRLRTIATITSFSVFLSVSLTGILVLVSAPDDDRLWHMALLIATAVPLAVAPLASYFMINLIIELEQVRASLFQMATRDGLTKVYNRRYFMDQLEAESTRAARTGSALSVMILDVDHFKDVNDQHGHPAGDLVLQRLAQACAASLRPYDVLARYGGEEFVVLMPGTSAADGQRLAERLRERIQALSITLADGQQVSVTASFGISKVMPDDIDGTVALARADTALYAAKRSGRNRSVLAPPADAPVSGGT